MKIKSRWDVSYKKMKPSHIRTMFNSTLIDCIINRIVINVIKKDTRLDFDEVKSVALEGMWKSLLTYKPSKGKFTTYASFKCRAYINKYLEKFYRIINNETNLVEGIKPDDKSFQNFENNLNNKITIKKILNKLSDKSREIIELIFFYNYNMKEIISIMKIKDKYRFYIIYNKAIEEAKMYV